MLPHSLRVVISLISCVSASFVVMPMAQASDQKLEGNYKDWAVYTRSVPGDKSCYAITKAKSKSPSSVKHGEIYFMVSNWRSGAATEQPSFLVSYKLNSNVAPEARIGSKKIEFYVADNEAFIDESVNEQALVRAMRAGSTMTMQAQSARGTRVSYSFSLSGVTAALKKAKSVCA